MVDLDKKKSLYCSLNGVVCPANRQGFFWLSEFNIGTGLIPYHRGGSRKICRGCENVKCL